MGERRQWVGFTVGPFLWRRAEMLMAGTMKPLIIFIKSKVINLCLHKSSSQNAATTLPIFHSFQGHRPTLTAIYMLSLYASKLIDLDVMSKSDPMAVVYMKKRNGTLEEIGRTEVILNDLNPVWIGKISVAYHFETVQSLVFHVFDVDTTHHNVPVKTIKLSDQDFLGEASCVLSEIFTKRDKTLTLKLNNKNRKNAGMLSVHAEESVASRNAAEIVFRCTHLDNKDFLSKSDPFLRISRKVETGNAVPICKTEVVNNNLNPIWRPVYLNTQHFVSKQNPLIVECFDFNSNGSHTLIGKLQTSVSALENMHRDKTGISFVKQHHGREKILKGQLYVDAFRERQLYSFLDYISSASNGNPRSPESLHYIDPSGRLNAYQQAITEVGEVIQFYDSDRRYSAWGFGGRTMDGSVSHCFNLNGSPYHTEVEGVEGIMTAYNSGLQTVALSGPTLFGKVVHRAAEIAGQSLEQTKSKYYVLLIITDGVLSDPQESIDALVRASDLPLSILIVGVGAADFTQMEILDADKGHRLESSTGRIATRDIVQFVPMRDVQVGQKPMVEALLEELPGQFLSYMRSRDIKPLNVNIETTLPQVHNVNYPV
ncbi:hypothetical protein SOVF_101810 [Spinacia oleracea]|nr:hypothetical protein SOVF_101810 [Spinacia oleracea]